MIPFGAKCVEILDGNIFLQFKLREILFFNLRRYFFNVLDDNKVFNCLVNINFFYFLSDDNSFNVLDGIIFLMF